MIGALNWADTAWIPTLLATYAIGSIPFAYLIVHLVTGEDITAHGSGNVGAMNVRRTTGSWGWFVVAMLSDGFKGFIPTLVAKVIAVGTGGVFAAAFTPWNEVLRTADGSWWSASGLWMPMAAIVGCVAGHNYSLWMAIMKRRFHRTGKGLATGGGALLAYDWRYFVIVVLVGLATIAITRYMMAGQVAAALSLPMGAALLGSPDFPFALVMGLVVYAAHHKRFIGMLRGREPKLYINDRMGPRG